MLDILFEVLLTCGELLLEAFIELIAGGIIDLMFRLVSEVSEFLEKISPITATLIYGFLGAFGGGCSLLIFPRHLIHPSRIPGISLLVSPVLTGAAFSTLGSFLRSRRKGTTQIEIFRNGYAFAFGMAFIRLLFAH